MPVALTYTTLQTALMVALVQAPSPYNVVPADFASLYPNAISYAESRVYAEIPLLANRTQNASLTVSSGSRLLNIGAMTGTPPLIVMERLALIGDTAALSPHNGTRYQYEKTTLDFIDQFWPQETATLSPNSAQWIGRYWAPVGVNYSSPTQLNTIVMAPTPDLGYTAECTGLFQPLPLSNSNTATYLSTYYPDLLVAACMVFLEGALQRNFGAQGIDPAETLSWEGIYMRLKAACESDEMRRRGLTPDQPPTQQPQQAH